MLRAMSENNPPEIQYIDSSNALITFCDAIKNSEWLAIDTEFVREKTYYPQLCLIQVSNGEQLACIDPIALDDIQPLLDVLYNESITKVFHAASQDLEIFANLRHALPVPLFDTQIAAALLGHGNQISYAALVQEYFDIELDKSHSRTDWSRRPLSDVQIQYAADDVLYLGKLYGLLSKQLSEMDRQRWLDDDFEQLANIDRYKINPDTSWQQVRGLDKVAGNKLVYVQALARWREQYAQKINKPKRWIIKDDILLAMADGPAKNNHDLDAAGLTSKTRDRYGKDWLELLNKANNIPADQHPVRQRFERLTNQQRSLGKKLMKALQSIGEEQQIDPGLIATRKIINKLVAGERDVPVLKGWRNDLAGQKLLAIIENEPTADSN